MNNNQSKNVAVIITAGLFFIFGFVTWINGALIPFMKTLNELTDAQSYLVASASYISFVVMALPASSIIKKIGYRKSMSLGLFIMAGGALVFLPAAQERFYWVFLAAIFIQGTGMTLLQTAANPYITILGPIESGAKRIAIMGIANKIAGALGSLIFGALLLGGLDDIKSKIGFVSPGEKTMLLTNMASRVLIPYLIMALVLLVLGILIRKAPLPNVDIEEKDESMDEMNVEKSIFRIPSLWFGIIALFFYVGVEVIAGDTIIAYGIALGIKASEAKFFTTFTLVCMVLTYALGVMLIPKYLKQKTALQISAILGIVLSICILNTSGLVSVLLVGTLGIANAMVWPALWPLTLDGLGKHTKTASALLIMGISGGAIIPPLYGKLVDINTQKLIGEGMEQANALAISANKSYWILIPCYLFILFFAFRGHKIKYWIKN